jgi:hypothetical protein
MQIQQGHNGHRSTVAVAMASQSSKAWLSSSALSETALMMAGLTAASFSTLSVSPTPHEMLSLFHDACGCGALAKLLDLDSPFSGPNLPCCCCKRALASMPPMALASLCKPESRIRLVACLSKRAGSHKPGTVLTCKEFCPLNTAHPTHCASEQGLCSLIFELGFLIFVSVFLAVLGFELRSHVPRPNNRDFESFIINKSLCRNGHWNTGVISGTCLP